MPWMTATSPLREDQTLSPRLLPSNNSNTHNSKDAKMAAMLKSRQRTTLTLERGNTILSGPLNADQSFQHVQHVQHTAAKGIGQEREKGFVVDAVVTGVQSTLPRKTVIPPYSAVNDKYAAAYFRSPTVQAVIERNKLLRDLREDREQLNKLSTRHRCKPTPTASALRMRQQRFVNDAIITEKSRSPRLDIIPKYSANNDPHCRKYFQRQDVKRLLKMTLTPRW